jgi:hypothetical protein
VLTTATRSSILELRHSTAPFVTYVVMGAVFQVIMWLPYHRHSDTGGLYLSAVFWLFVIYKIVSFRWYRVRVNQRSVSKRPFGTLKWETIEFSDIARVERRRLNPSFRENNSQLPTSRLELWTRSGRLFAVSLVHFRAADIQELLNRIKRERPELELPSLVSKGRERE